MKDETRGRAHMTDSLIATTTCYLFYAWKVVSKVSLFRSRGASCTIISDMDIIESKT